MRTWVVAALAWTCLGGCAQRIACVPSGAEGVVSPTGATAPKKNLHAPTRTWLFVLSVEDSRQDVCDRADSILRSAGIGYAANGSLSIAYTVEHADAERAAHLLRADPLTRPHVHELTEACARTGFYKAEKAWLRLVHKPSTGTDLARLVMGIDALLTPAEICAEWSWDGGDLILEVLPQEESRVRAMLKADPLLAPFLKD